MDEVGIAFAGDVAAEIERRLPGVGETKLHKLLYYVQGYHLAWEGRPAFHDAIEAWELGPVVVSLWRDRKHGATSKTNRSSAQGSTLPESVRNITVNVISRLGHLTGRELIRSTHTEEPWRAATNGGRNIANQVISHRSLIDFFSVEPDWVTQMREHVATARDNQAFAPDPPGALDAVMAKYFSG
ncbi:Panacea domain-containing protein [Candidatus Poriferisocius sp.]|uniref:Panacea domain-containing protein n=1 Tax=Candidatus Poriferisocius sp. TaxID=3101276 RepID=UPI003B59F387